MVRKHNLWVIRRHLSLEMEERWTVSPRCGSDSYVTVVRHDHGPSCVPYVPLSLRIGGFWTIPMGNPIEYEVIETVVMLYPKTVFNQF